MSFASKLLALALMLSALGVTGAAQTQVHGRLDEVGLRASVHAPWPDQLLRGYSPLFVELQNTSDRALAVDLESRIHNYRGLPATTKRRVTVAAKSSLRVELFTPVFSWGNSQLEVKSAGKKGTAYLGSFDTHGFSIHPVLVVTEREASASEIEGWAAALMTEEHTVGGDRLPNIALATLPGLDLPRRLESYTSLDALLVDTSDRPPAQALEAALAWARLGGNLVLAGPNARAYAGELPGVAQWVEERFRLPDAQGAAAPGVTTYVFGLGRVVIVEESSFLAEPGAAAAVGRCLDQSPGFLQGATWSKWRWPRIPGLDRLPFRLLICLLIAFAVLMGPVNFLSVRATGKPALLLVTIPILALLLSLGIVLFGLGYQGIETEQSVRSLTVLDQRAHRADSVALRSFFAPLAAGDALRPGPLTVCFPDVEEESGGASISMGSELLLSGGYLPARQETNQQILSEIAARGRLSFAREGDGYTVENGLSVPVERLAFRDAQGRLFASPEEAGPIAAGARVSLEPVLAALPSVFNAPSYLFPLDVSIPGDPVPSSPWTERLPAGSYLALVPENPFPDDCGLNASEVAGVHRVYGVLELSEVGR